MPAADQNTRSRARPEDPNLARVSPQWPDEWKENPMALTQGAYQGYDFNRMIVQFTMMNGDSEVRCAISTGALDDLDRPFKATSAQREAQFLKLRGRIEERIA